MKKLLLMAVVTGLGLAALGTLTACNTVEGIGRDFESAGRSIQDAF